MKHKKPNHSDFEAMPLLNGDSVGIFRPMDGVDVLSTSQPLDFGDKPTVDDQQFLLEMKRSATYGQHFHSMLIWPDNVACAFFAPKGFTGDLPDATITEGYYLGFQLLVTGGIQNSDEITVDTSTAQPDNAMAVH
jgi:hypothetical protein